MEVRLPDEFSPETVYFTPADLSFQRLAHYTPVAFERAVKIWVLLADTLVVAASHVFESPVTAEFVLQNPRLVREGIIVPSLRDDSDNFRDFVVSHRDKGDHTAYFRDNFEDLLAMAAFMDSNVQIAYSWSFGPSSESFKQSILMDLENRASPLRRRLRGIPNSRISDFQAAVDSMPYASRERLAAAAIEAIPQRVAALTSYWDTQYYLNSAASSTNTPLLDALSLRWMTDDFEQRCQATNTALLPDVFDQLVVRMGLSSHLLDMLTIDDLVDLRRTPECRAFRKAVWANTQCESLEGMPDDSAARLLLESISHQLAANTAARRKLETGIALAGPVVGMTGLALSHSAAVLAPAATAFEVAGVALTVVGVKPVLDRLRSRRDPLGAFLLKMRARAEERENRRG